MLTGHTIKADHADVFTFLAGNLQSSASHCETPEQALSGSLVYASTAAQVAEALLRCPAILIIASNACADVDATRYGDTCCFSVCNIAMGMAKLLKYFDQKRCRFTQWGERHPTALVHPQATIGAGVFLGPYCVIGAGAAIGEGCLIGAHAVIENHARVGARTVIHPHVFVGFDCQVGEDCEIHPHSTIGSDGFGYSVGADGRPLKISHLGNVEIGDKVEIGSNCAVDRATLTSTHIRSGTKLDNFCHVAHNCDLGEDGLYTAGFMTGGSTKIGRRFTTGGGTVVTAHVTLADNVALAGRSTVTNDIHQAGRYGGYPLQPLQQAMKTVVSIGQLNQLRRNLNRVMKHLRLGPETLR
ncbi:MAG: UDP-3-O-(3-hydroxymyristoyl)glucosamine N-acyltransferase [Steroidobacteraceae bacterium]|jgi:UDP-3-O-[3-hydroxymyristoyl] glucosamine N-acyltransferase